MTDPTLCLVVALPAEAKPVIRALGLKRLQPDGRFPRYGRGAITLLLSGPGQKACGEAVAFAQQRCSNPRTQWLNLGIAGHARLVPGDTLLADRIVDTATGESWTLSPAAGLPHTVSGPLHCVAEAESRFESPVGYDMESAAIARALREQACLDRLHVLKVISDNPANPSRRISGRMVGELIENALPTLNLLVRRLLPHAETV